MKKSLLTVLAFILGLQLSACSGDDSGEPAEISTRAFKNFTINVPDDWRKIPRESFANTIPNETVGLFVKRTEGEDFIQNLNIIKESLNTDATSLEYAKANILLGSRAIIDYRPLNTEETEINGIKTVHHTFRARNSGTDPIRHFSQSYFSRDRIGYTLTCISKEDLEDQQQLCKSIIESFQLRG